ncbi:hypothetical protein DV532_25005 [Pseudomonas sp. Leaf58]|uniref:hypothetical protein n=1 Tax=Pseudomonas TaxID=286 RepID=UPI0006F365C5|nr:hypothetical protein [Pseudomonas sp. Leaf58]AYG47378.1 hypothetical protein DV532_25005 [Pseudomonas sp. Leaf58]KQN66176.1 hypothetical protein ASF02_00745 [Pseudomonas sp. Leaf58]
MNTIENLFAYNNDVPGEPTFFEVQGTVTVAHPGIEPVLVEPAVRHRGGWEVLELKLIEKEGVALQVGTTKQVSFRREGGTTWKALEIIQPEGGSQRVEIGHREAINGQ